MTGSRGWTRVSNLSQDDVTSGGGNVVNVPPRRRYARLVGVAAAVLALTAASACSQGASAQWRAAGSTSGSSGEAGGATAKKVPGEFKFTPATDATDVSVLDGVTVTAQDATIETVSLTNPEGRQIKGDLDADKHTWKSTEELGYGKAYTVAVSGTNSGGQPLQQTSKFTTIKPRNLTLPYLRASDLHLLKERSTYGVGQTLQIWFDEAVPDKAAAQKLLEVKTDPPTEGGWYWHSAKKVEWRSKEYLKPGTTVSVKGNFYGKDLGNGLYGQADVSGSFKVDRSRIAIADNTTHLMDVFIDGQKVRTVPVSLGKGGERTLPDGSKINYWTNSGAHVVLEKAPVTRMTSASYGVTDPKDPNFYDEQIKLTAKISNTGEYFHEADWNIAAHGHANTSHGCINIGPANSRWMYDTFQPGDIVDVRNTPVRLAATNGNGAWTLSWDQWLKGSAL